MEKIILFLIVFGIGSLYEYIRQLKEKRAKTAHAGKSPRAATDSEEAPAFQPFMSFNKMINNSLRDISRALEEQPRKAPEKPAPPVPAPAPLQTDSRQAAKGKSREFLPGELLDIPAAEPDLPMEIAEPESIKPLAGENVDKATAEHYARWRQAIIDTTIITPKFDDNRF